MTSCMSVFNVMMTVSIVARVFIHVFIVSIYCVYLVYNAVQCTVEYSKQMVRESSSKVLLCRGSGHNWGWQRLLCCTLYSLYITVYTIIFIFELSLPVWQF